MLENKNCFQNAFLPKITKPNLKVKMLSYSEFSDPNKYSKKPINDYDGFTRIYFNNNPSRKKINIASRRYYNNKSNKIHKESQSIHDSPFVLKEHICIINKAIKENSSELKVVTDKQLLNTWSI